MANQIAYGFTNLTDVFARRVTQVGVDIVTAAIEASVTEHNRQMDALLRLFARRTTKYKARYRTPATARLQPVDNAGRARPIRGGSKYDVAFPLQAGAAAWGQDYVTSVKMTVEEANDFTVALLSADMRWMRDHILAALYTNVSWTFNDENDDIGSLTVKGLANGDTDTFFIPTGADSMITDTHFLAQAAAIADGTNPFPTIYTELREHPENGGEVVALIPTNLRASTEALALFRPVQDPNVRPGANTAILVGDLGIAVPGEIYGYCEKVWLAEWRSLPDNYIIAVTTNGEPPLGLREDEETELQGFKLVANRDDYPWYERQYLRRAGFGGWNRVGAVIQRIGNAGYGVPSNYSSPMP